MKVDQYADTQEYSRCGVHIRAILSEADQANFEACFEGDEHAVDALIAWCAFGPKNGRIVEQGNHGELLDLQGYYWRLHQSGIQLEEAA